jgi:hypothetical protein
LGMDLQPSSARRRSSWQGPWLFDSCSSRSPTHHMRVDRPGKPDPNCETLYCGSSFRSTPLSGGIHRFARPDRGHSVLSAEEAGSREGAARAARLLPGSARWACSCACSRGNRMLMFAMRSDIVIAMDATIRRVDENNCYLPRYSARPCLAICPGLCHGICHGLTIRDIKAFDYRPAAVGGAR